MSVPPAVRSVVFTCSLLALAALRAEQNRMFGMIQIVIMPCGERVVIGKAKKKASGLALEHSFLPLGGILKDDGVWWDSGIRIREDLPGGFQGFAARDFVAPYKTRHDPNTATALSNNAMPPHRFDKALRFILQREVLMSLQQARLYSQHSFRHFLPKCLLKSILLRLRISTRSSFFGMRLVRLTRLLSSPLLIKPELIYIHVYKYICKYIYIYTCACTCMRICVYVCVFTCVIKTGVHLRHGRCMRLGNEHRFVCEKERESVCVCLYVYACVCVNERERLCVCVFM